MQEAWALTRPCGSMDPGFPLCPSFSSFFSRTGPWTPRLCVLCLLEPGSWSYLGLYPSGPPHSLVQLPYYYTECVTSQGAVQLLLTFLVFAIL